MDSKRLFQKIFGVQMGSADSEKKILRAAEKYPYFLAPVLFSGELKDKNHILNRRSPLFFSNNLMETYAKQDEPLSYTTVMTSEPGAISLNVENEKTMADELKNEKIEEIAVPESAPIPDLPSTDLEPAFAEEMAPLISGIENETANPAKKGIATVPQSTPEELIFEPLHTTDYFASQGIRLSEEVKSGDKLGTQLKSFTEWLKTMKKLPAAGNRPVLNTPYDKQVEKLAEKSNQEEDVITESMADAYLSQGKRQKAIEIYQKLSLQNPSKSAFFAAKIAELSPGAYPA